MNFRGKFPEISGLTSHNPNSHTLIFTINLFAGYGKFDLLDDSFATKSMSENCSTCKYSIRHLDVVFISLNL